MPTTNDLTKNLQVYFDQTVEGFDASVVLAQQAAQYTPQATDMSRANNTFWRPQPAILQVRSGWDTTGVDPESLQKLSVPASLNSPGNIEIALNLQEMQDPSNMATATAAAQLQLAAHVDLAVAETVARTGSLVITGNGPMNWKMGATADAVMNEQGVKMGSERSMFLSPQHYIDIADELKSKQFHQGDVKTAWDEARIPNIAGFKTFQTDYTGYIPAPTVAVTAALTADVAYVPKAMTTNNGGNGEVPVDNRFATMSVDITAGELRPGDAFTVAGVYAVHHIKKTATPRLKTFRVVKVEGAIVTYCPPIIPDGPYQNVTVKGAAGAALSVINNTDQAPTSFWRKDSVELIRGSFDNLGNLNGGARFMKATTKKLGLPIAMLYWLDGKSVIYAVKWLVFFGVNNLNPEMNGIILPNQISTATMSTASRKG